MDDATTEHGHDHHHDIDEALVKAADICRKKGIRLTYLRKRVLELVWQAHKPVGAYTLLDQLSEFGRKAAPPTVYRALDFLMNQGFVHRLTSLNAFVGCPNPGHSKYSQFLICSECSEVYEMQDNDVVQAISQCANTCGFEVKGEIVEITGVCEDCRRA